MEQKVFGLSDLSPHIALRRSIFRSVLIRSFIWVLTCHPSSPPPSIVDFWETKAEETLVIHRVRSNAWKSQTLSREKKKKNARRLLIRAYFCLACSWHLRHPFDPIPSQHINYISSVTFAIHRTAPALPKADLCFFYASCLSFRATFVFAPLISGYLWSQHQSIICIEN